MSECIEIRERVAAVYLCHWSGTVGDRPARILPSISFDPGPILWSRLPDTRARH